MSKRIYNILFHTHTISGIIISGLLYVIFFTGSISFLRDEINAWERNEPIEQGFFGKIDFDSVFQHLEKEHQLYGRDISMTQYYDERRVNTTISASQDTTISKKENKRSFFYLDILTKKSSNYTANYSLGEFFYRLHFFAQLNFFGRSGYMLAGLVAFFFLFAIVTGVLVHWKKIIPNFFVFRPGAKWKTIWTDAHVGLGILGLPYQFMFAVTGAYLIIGYSLMLDPVKKILFDGDQKKMTASMQYVEVDHYELSGKRLNYTIPIQKYVNETKATYKELGLRSVEVYNYGDENMHVKVAGSPVHKSKFLGSGYLIFNAVTGEIIGEKDPYATTSYKEGAINTILRLHFGDFGGYGMKLIYLVLGLVTCFVILSGVMIWLVARDKKHVDLRKRKFNSWLVHIYLAVCLSMYPVTAFSFCMVKWLGSEVIENRRAFIYDWFFWPWLTLSLFFVFMRNDRLTTKASLWLGSIIGFLVPVANGLVSGNWLWVTLQKGYSQIFVVDLFWILLSITSLFVLLKMKGKKPEPGSSSSKKATPKGVKQYSV